LYCNLLMMMRYWRAFYLLAAIAAFESKAENVALHERGIEATQLRGVAKKIKLMHNISESQIRINTASKAVHKIVQTHAQPFHDVKAAKIGSKKFAQQLKDFWKQSSEKIADGDTKNGYIDGILFVVDPTTETGAAYSDMGGLSFEFLSWGGLAIGIADDIDKIQEMMILAQNKDCNIKLIEKGKELTINLFGQGLGLASTFAGDPTGGAVFGVASATLSATSEYGEKLSSWLWQTTETSVENLDVLEKSPCDDWLKNFAESENPSVEIKEPEKIEKLPSVFRLQKTEKKEKIEKYKAKANAIMQEYKATEWTEEKAKKVIKEIEERSWFDPRNYLPTFGY